MMSCDQAGEGHLENRFPGAGRKYALAKSARLNKQHEFTAVFRGNNRRVGDRYWTVLALPREPLPGSPMQKSARLGLAIAKKRARRAVDRNRLKRIVRESFRQHQAVISGFDIIVMNRDSCVGASNVDLNRSLLRLWKKLPDAQSKGGQGKKNAGYLVRQQSHESKTKRVTSEQAGTKSGLGRAQ